ncbi:MAG: hypothetical protein KDD62_16365, partial [Bdellovibrionales bacterium]|nr:hypothetical protein [Bdellovibrionales bacterium]
FWNFYKASAFSPVKKLHYSIMGKALIRDYHASLYTKVDFKEHSAPGRLGITYLARILGSAQRLELQFEYAERSRFFE